jgi:transcriptional regulator with XRE-family HTH domain
MRPTDVVRWRGRCPLRVWLNTQEHGALADLVKQMEVHRTTVEKWMQGDVQPRMKGFAKLQELTGITASSWMDWLDSRPKVKSAG